MRKGFRSDAQSERASTTPCKEQQQEQEWHMRTQSVLQIYATNGLANWRDYLQRLYNRREKSRPAGYSLYTTRYPQQQQAQMAAQRDGPEARRIPGGARTAAL
jgi:hypothetical protein